MNCVRMRTYRVGQGSHSSVTGEFRASVVIISAIEAVPRLIRAGSRLFALPNVNLTPINMALEQTRGILSTVSGVERFRIRNEPLRKY